MIQVNRCGKNMYFNCCMVVLEDSRHEELKILTDKKKFDITSIAES